MVTVTNKGSTLINGLVSLLGVDAEKSLEGLFFELDTEQGVLAKELPNKVIVLTPLQGKKLTVYGPRLVYAKTSESKAKVLLPFEGGILEAVAGDYKVMIYEQSM